MIINDLKNSGASAPKKIINLTDKLKINTFGKLNQIIISKVMDDIDMPAYSPTVMHAVFAHKGEEDWYDKSLRRVVFSVISDNEKCFRPINDKSVDYSFDFVERVRKALEEYGRFPQYEIGNMWISFKVLHNIQKGAVRLRLYIYASRFHLYRIVLPTNEAISAILQLIDSYHEFEKEIKKFQNNP